MSRTLRVILALIVASVALALIIDAFDLSGSLSLLGLLIVMFFVSLFDREGFYGTSGR